MALSGCLLTAEKVIGLVAIAANIATTGGYRGTRRPPVGYKSWKSLL